MVSMMTALKKLREMRSKHSRAALQKLYPCIAVITMLLHAYSICSGLVHTNMDVSKLVDVLHNALNTTENALEAIDQAYQKPVLGVGLLSELQEEVQKLNNCQNERSKRLKVVV